METVLDVSRHQGAIDWQRAATRLRELGSTPRVAIRATVGDYYIDPLFLENWTNARAAGFRVTAYHAVTPDRPAAAQADWFLNVVGALGATPNFSDAFDWVLDCELARGQSVRTVTQNIKAVLTLIGGNAAIYTRASWWNYNVDTSQTGWYSSRPLWVAHYGAQAPLLPAGWHDWSLWQYSADGNGRGAEFGAQSDSIDLSHIRTDAPQQPPPVGILLQVTTNALHIRERPSVAARITGKLLKGDVVKVQDIYSKPGASGEVWIRHTSGWSALDYHGYVYMTNPQ